MMPISVPGRTSIPAASGSPATGGFTLVEALVVLCIVGILATAAGLGAVADSSARKLQHDARRLAHLFVMAQNDARAWGYKLEWRFTTEGYRFERHNRSAPAPSIAVPTNANPSVAPLPQALQARRWHSDTAVHVLLQPPAPAVFSGDWLSGPEHVALSNGRDTVHIVRAALGTYKVTP